MTSDIELSRGGQAEASATDARFYREMLRIRAFEDRLYQLFLDGLVPGTMHLCQGQEAVPVGLASVLQPQDVVSATYRGHCIAFALGSEPASLLAEILGRATGVCGGRAGSMNIVDRAHRLLGCFGIVGGSIGCATGAAISAQLLAANGVSVAVFGDGAANQGYFHECLNLAAVMRLPAVYVCENNLYGEWTPMRAVTAGGDIAARAASYAMPAQKIDGNDVDAVAAALGSAVAAARSGEGPQFIECLTYRHQGHSRADPAKYRPAEEVSEWLARDPIQRIRARLDTRIRAAIDTDVADEIEYAVQAAVADPFPALFDEMGSRS
jgi:acetoin:2,6-dichlorophenolindophenol oxidoreductase subunit alpha